MKKYLQFITVVGFLIPLAAGAQFPPGYAGMMMSGVTPSYARPAATPSAAPASSPAAAVDRARYMMGAPAAFGGGRSPASSFAVPASSLASSAAFSDGGFFVYFRDSEEIEGSTFTLATFQPVRSYTSASCSYVSRQPVWDPNYRVVETSLGSASVVIPAITPPFTTQYQEINPPSSLPTNPSATVNLKCRFSDGNGHTKDSLVAIPRIVKDPDVNASLSIVSSGYPSDPSGPWGGPVNDGGLMGLVSGSARSVSNIIRITAGTEVRNITQRPSLNVGIQMRVPLGLSRQCRRSVPVSATNQAGRTTTVTASVTLTTAQCNALNPCRDPALQNDQVACESTLDRPEIDLFCKWDPAGDGFCYSKDDPRPGL